MDAKTLKQILAGISIASLLAGGLALSSCNRLGGCG